MDEVTAGLEGWIWIWILDCFFRTEIAFEAFCCFVPAFSSDSHLKTCYHIIIFPQVTGKWIDVKLVQLRIMTLNLVFSEKVRKVYHAAVCVKIHLGEISLRHLFIFSFVTLWCSAAYMLAKACNEGAGGSDRASEWRSWRWGEIFLTWLHSGTSGESDVISWFAPFSHILPGSFTQSEAAAVASSHMHKQTRKNTHWLKK